MVVTLGVTYPTSTKDGHIQHKRSPLSHAPWACPRAPRDVGEPDPFLPEPRVPQPEKATAS